MFDCQRATQFLLGGFKLVKRSEVSETKPITVSIETAVFNQPKMMKHRDIIRIY